MEDDIRERPKRPVATPTILDLVPSIEGFPAGSAGKESACNAGDLDSIQEDPLGRPQFSSWVGKILWRRARQPTPVFLPGESPWTEGPGGLSSMGSHRVRHGRMTELSTAYTSIKSSFLCMALRSGLYPLCHSEGLP